MINNSQIQDLTERIAQQFHPERIILFGSYAYGTPREDSDADILVVMQYAGRSTRQAIEILDAVAPTFAIDLLVRTPDEITQRLGWNDFFLREVVEKGKVLYDAAIH